VLIISPRYWRYSEISRYFRRAKISPTKYRDILWFWKYRAISDISPIFRKISRDDGKYRPWQWNLSARPIKFDFWFFSCHFDFLSAGEGMWVLPRRVWTFHSHYCQFATNNEDFSKLQVPRTVRHLILPYNHFAWFLFSISKCKGF